MKVKHGTVLLIVFACFGLLSSTAQNDAVSSRGTIGTAVVHLAADYVKHSTGCDAADASIDVTLRGYDPNWVLDFQRKPPVVFIASLPDPIHTHLALLFDRAIDSIGQAAEASDLFRFDRAKLQWRDTDSQSSQTSAASDCPGLIVFRPANDGPALLVFVVGETPTSGIEKAQFRTAVMYTRCILPKEEVLRILGPSFSGALFSLSELAAENRQLQFHVYSGSVSSAAAISLFTRRTSNASILTFQESDEFMVDRLVSYEKTNGVRPNEMALLTEEETEYGAGLSSSGIMRLFFPREISHLRTAYQHDVLTAQPQSHSASSSPPVVTTNFDISGHEDDAIEPFAHGQYPMSQEAVMLGITGSLRRYKTRIVVVSATDPLDQVFLVEYLHRYYPAARVVTIGSDLLFMRQSVPTSLYGTLSLSTYSLAAKVDDLTERDQSFRNNGRERVFSDSISVGTYNALLFALEHPSFHLTDTVLPATNLLEYGRHALMLDEPSAAHTTTVPPVWLSVLGKDSYWPVAVLTDKGTPEGLGSRLLHPVSVSPGHVRYRLWVQGAFRAVCALILIFSLFHTWLSWNGSVLSASELTARFAPMPSFSRTMLVTFQYSCVIVTLILAIVPWEFRSATLFPSASHLGVILVVALAFVVAFSILDIRRRILCEDEKTIPIIFAATCLVLLCIVATVVFVAHLSVVGLFVRNWKIEIYRYVNLGSSVSPAVPLLLMIVSYYWWAWYGLAGLSYVDYRAPQLPPDPDPSTSKDDPFYQIRQPRAVLLRNIMIPMSVDERVYGIGVGLFVCALLFAGQIRNVLSLEGMAFDLLMNGLLLVSLVLFAMGIMRLIFTWLELRRLLQSLERFRFRRSFILIRGFGWSSIWSAGGSAFRDSYRLLAAELDSAAGLVHTLSAEHPVTEAERTAIDTFAGEYTLLLKCVQQLVTNYRENIRSYLADKLIKIEEVVEAANACDHLTVAVRVRHEVSVRERLNAFLTPAREQVRILRASSLIKSLSIVQAQFAKVGSAGLALLPFYWCKEESSWTAGMGFEPEQNQQLQRWASDNKALAGIEHFVCIVYVNFILNVVARIRTQVLSTAGLFVLPMIALAIYPFQPMAALTTFAIAEFAALVLCVGVVYGQMHKDATLSRITNTRPGELGLDFWLRFGGFILAPLISLAAAQLPQVSSFLLGWLQPGLERLSH